MLGDQKRRRFRQPVRDEKQAVKGDTFLHVKDVAVDTAHIVCAHVDAFVGLRRADIQIGNAKHLQIVLTVAFQLFRKVLGRHIGVSFGRPLRVQALYVFFQCICVVLTVRITDGWGFGV